MNVPNLLVDLSIVVLFLVGVAQFRSVRGARAGNLTAAFALACSVALVLYRSTIIGAGWAASALIAGCAIGWWIAVQVNMVQIPAMVAFQHGAGGVAAFLVAYGELTRVGEPAGAAATWSGVLGLIIGAATFSGSMIASGKLAGRIRQAPVFLPDHNGILLALVVIIGVLTLPAAATPGPVSPAVLWAMILLSAALGAIFAIRIGGADMPVLISFLNATAGLAAAFCGVSIGNRLLAACGATVAASGSVLTHQMCVAMNRPLARVFVPLALARSKTAEPALHTPDAAPTPAAVDPFERAMDLARQAATVMIVPGYGMAQAQAQFETVRLARRLTDMGKQVKFAIHPIAGRMPGHMHVLLAEAEVDPDMLADLREANPEFETTDLAVIVGACDVVNPAAIIATGTPISGMPILKAHHARHAVVCNLDERPGYSGVANPLYADPKTILLFGDARQTLERLLAGLSQPEPAAARTAST